MDRDWSDFKSLHGNIAGAREAFENACETLYRKKFSDHNVSQIAVKQGDGGIDIYIGELGVEPITVIQCKFFLESFGASQQSQIRESFKTANTSTKFELKEWILCIPRVIDIDVTAWWSKWKKKQVDDNSKDNSFIKLVNGNAIIDLLKELDLYNQVFKIEDSIKIAEIHEALISKKPCIPKGVKPNAVLFNNYTAKNEPFYLERDIDSVFNGSLDINNIWLFGKSGAGKTALINRNLIQNKIEYCFCDLSPVTILKSDDVLEEILGTVEDKFEVDRNPREKNKLKQITQVLNKSGTSKIVIVIDELSVQEDLVLKDIANKFIQLVTHYNNQSDNDELKFVVSTICEPVKIIRNKSKAADCFQYVCCDSWQNYSIQLFDILCAALNLKLDDSKDLIIESSKNSPRILKYIFKKIVISRDVSESAVERAIQITLEEVVDNG
jgi:hypothetical protein